MSDRKWQVKGRKSKSGQMRFGLPGALARSMPDAVWFELSILEDGFRLRYVGEAGDRETEIVPLAFIEEPR